MQQIVHINEFLNDKGQLRYLIVDIWGHELHRAGGAGFKTVESAKSFADSHQWSVISGPKATVMAEPLF